MEPVPSLDLRGFADFLLRQYGSAGPQQPRLNPYTGQYPVLDMLLSERQPTLLTTEGVPGNTGHVAPSFFADLANSKYGLVAKARKARARLESAGYLKTASPDYENFSKIFTSPDAVISGQHIFTAELITRVQEVLATISTWVDIVNFVSGEEPTAVDLMQAVDFKPGEKTALLGKTVVVSRAYVCSVEDGLMTCDPAIAQYLAANAMETILADSELEDPVTEESLRDEHRVLRHACEAARILQLGEAGTLCILEKCQEFVRHLVDFRLHETVDKQVRFSLNSEDAVVKAFRLLRVAEDSGSHQLWKLSVIIPAVGDFSGIADLLKAALEEAGVVAHSPKQDKAYVKELMSRLRRDKDKRILKYRECTASLRVLEATGFRLDVRRNLVEEVGRKLAAVNHNQASM